MSFIKGPINAVFFKVTSDGSVDLDQVRTKLSTGFTPPMSLQTEALGFVSSLLVNDIPDQDPLCVVDDFLFCDFRRDTKRVNSKLVKAEVERKIREERAGKRFSRKEMKEEKELARTKLLAASIPNVATYPVLISSKSKVVAFGTASKKVVESFTSCFQDLTGLSLERVTAFTLAKDWAGSFKRTLDEEAYVGKDDLDLKELKSINMADGNDLYKTLGYDFLSYIIHQAYKGKKVLNWTVENYDKVDVVSPVEYKVRVSGKGTQDSGLVEQVIKGGSVIVKSHFDLKDQDEQEWPVTLNAESFCLGNLKVPQEKGKLDEAGARLVRGELTIEFYHSLQNSFHAFMNERILRTWNDTWKKSSKN